MRNMFDFSSWSSLITTVLGLLLMTLMMMGVRLLFYADHPKAPRA